MYTNDLIYKYVYVCVCISTYINFYFLKTKFSVDC